MTGFEKLQPWARVPVTLCALFVGVMKATAQCEIGGGYIFPSGSVHTSSNVVGSSLESCSAYFEFGVSVEPALGLLCIDGQYVPYEPDGAELATANTDVGASAGISGIRVRGLMPLLGVFTAARPGEPVPPHLDFNLIGTDFTELHPAINQLFFIGDGLTGNGVGTRQKFWQPPGEAFLRVGFARSAVPGGPPCCLEANQCPIIFDAGIAVRVRPFFTHLAAIVGRATAVQYAGVSFRASSIGNPFTQPTLVASAMAINWCDAQDWGFTLQWRKDGVPLADGPTATGSIIRGATAGELFVLDGRSADAGMYDCVVTSDCQSVVSNAQPVTICNRGFDWFYDATPGDLFLFLELYFSGDPRADVNETGGLSVQDIFDFLAGFFGPYC
jgi:hypothetical protein